jgi:hypothetical protein
MKITNAEFGKSLRLVADTIMRKDGDRDYMNPSNLNVQQTTAIADLLRGAAERLARSNAE